MQLEIVVIAEIWGFLNNSRPSANIATRLRFAWSQLQMSFQDVVTSEQLSDPSGLLLKQDVCRRAYVRMAQPPFSVTMAITMDLEKQREEHLGLQITEALGRTDYKK